MKLIGLLLLFLAASLTGVYAAAAATAEQAQTEALLRFLQFLREKVRQRVGFAECIAAYGKVISPDDPLEKCGFWQVLAAGGEMDDALSRCHAVKKETAMLFSELGKKLQNSFSEELSALLDRDEQELAQTVKALSQGLAGKKRVSVTFGVCTGALLVILLW